MNDTTPVRRSVATSSMIGAWAILGAALGSGVCGCADHRISQAEFLTLLQEQPADAPAAAPAEDSAEVRALLDRELGPYRVGPSDVLAVILTEASEVPLIPMTHVRVDRNGEIDLPLVGAIKVAGLELEDVEDTIHGAFVPHVVKDATVHVELMAPDTTEVVVVGAVANPGLVLLRRTERDLLHAIVSAGGMYDVASGEATLRRLREPGTAVTMNLTEPEGLRRAMELDPLEDGDILTVHAAAPNTVFVGGLVNAPHPQTYPAGVDMTVLQALAAAGGLRTDVIPREATLIRRMPGGEDIHVKLNLDRITTGKDENLLLAAGDVLWVPHTVETRVQDWVNRNIFFRAGVSATAGVNYNATGIEYLNSNARQEAFNLQPNLEQSFDPLGFLQRNQALQQIGTQQQTAP